MLSLDERRRIQTEIKLLVRATLTKFQWLGDKMPAAELAVERLVVIEENKDSVRAGVAHGSSIIKLNLTLLTDAEKYERTLAHEWAHALCAIVYKKKCGHGAEWKDMMYRMGRQPDRCHSYDVVAAMPHKYTKITCVNCKYEHQFSNRRMALCRSGRSYRCRCGTTLPTTVGQMTNPPADRQFVAAQAAPLASRPAHNCRCDKCGETFNVTNRRIAKMTRGTVYSHVKCGGKLVL